MLRARPPDVHVVLTGRGAVPALAGCADLATEMAEVRRPCRRGVKAQPASTSECADGEARQDGLMAPGLPGRAGRTREAQRSTAGGGWPTMGARREDTPIAASEEPARRFCLDLHAHSADASDDAGGTVEGYLKWIAARRRRGYRVDGFVLTEHRQFDPALNYDALAERYGVVVLRGAELETDAGHVLVYGVGEEFARRFDLGAVDLPAAEVFRVARESGGFAVGAHAGRPGIGLAEHAAAGYPLDAVEAVETLNGGSSDAENALADRLAARHGLGRVGGSDAHYVSAIGRCLTAFARPVTSIGALVRELAAGDYYPITIEQTREDAAAGA